MRRWPSRRTPERSPSPLRSRFPAELLHRAKRKTAFRLSFFYLIQELVLALDNNTGTDGTAAFTDSEAEALLDSDRGDQLDLHVDVIARHTHLNAFGQGDDAGNVSGSEVELRTTDVTDTIKLPDGVEMVMPGDNIEMEITLITPIAMDEGLRFAIREGGRTVASGVVHNIIE